MKGKYSFTGLLVVLMLFVSCTKEETEPTFTVWTMSISNSDYPGTIDDGKYIQVELTNAQFNNLVEGLNPEYKRKWKEKQIYDWFVGRDFIPSQATQKTAWITTTTHGMITTRSGNMVYSIVK